MWASLEPVIHALQEVNESTVETKVKASASALLKNVKGFDFIASLMFMKNIMLKTKFLCDTLQREELNIIQALEITKATIKSLERINSDEMEITSQITALMEYSEKLDIDAEAEFSRYFTECDDHQGDWTIIQKQTIQVCLGCSGNAIRRGSSVLDDRFTRSTQPLGGFGGMLPLEIFKI